MKNIRNNQSNIETKKRMNLKNEKQKRKMRYDSEISNSEDYVII